MFLGTRSDRSDMPTRGVATGAFGCGDIARSARDDQLARPRTGARGFDGAGLFDEVPWQQLFSAVTAQRNLQIFPEMGNGVLLFVSQVAPLLVFRRK